MKREKRAQFLDPQSPVEGGRSNLQPSPVLKTPKPQKDAIVFQLDAERHRWNTASSSGPLCDCLERFNRTSTDWGARRKQLKETNPLFPIVTATVKLEQLTCSLTNAVNQFWKSEGRCEPKGGQELQSRSKPNSPSSIMIQKAQFVVNAVRQAGCIQATVTHWLARPDLRSSMQFHEEMADARFERLQEFWGQFHESAARKPPRRKMAEQNARRNASSRDGRRAPAPTSLTSAEAGEGNASASEPESDDEDKIGNPLFVDCAGPKLWHSQGYFPRVVRHASPRHIEDQAAQWKERTAQSHCHAARSGGLQTLSKTMVQNNFGFDSTASSWYKKAEDTFMSQASQPIVTSRQSLYQRMGDPVHLGLSTFLTPKHLKATSGMNKSCSLPELVGSAGGSSPVSTHRKVPSLRRKQTDDRGQLTLKLDREHSFATALNETTTSESVRWALNQVDANMKHEIAKPQTTFTTPWRAAEASALLSHATPTGTYLQVCRDRGTIPAVLPFVTGHSTDLVAAGKDLVDNDLQAVTCMIRGVRMEKVDLSDNVRLTERSLGPLVEALVGLPVCENLKHLSLGRCSGVGSKTMDTLVKLIADPIIGACKLQHLDLSGIAIGVRSQLPLCRALNTHTAVHTVRLAETGLGHADARQCITEIASSQTITDLDLGWNCFDSEVFTLLGEKLVETATLRKLSIANCSAAMDANAGGRVRQRLRDDCTPLVFFIETLQRNSKLTFLDISINRIDFRAALVIEDAMEDNTALRELDVSFNPLGPHGMRNMLRLLTRDRSGLVHFNCISCCQARVEPFAKDVVFSIANPSGRYRLNLARPEERSMLRMLYKSCDRFGLPPDAAFTDLTCTEKGYQHPPKDASGWREVPCKGILKTIFTIEKMKEGGLKDVGEWDFPYFLDRVFSTARQKPGFHKAVPLMGLWREMEGHFQAQGTLLEALSKDFHLPYHQIRQFCDSRHHEMIVVVLTSLLGCLEKGVAPRSLALLLTPAPADAVKILKTIENFLAFNPGNPTGHYKLDLANPTDHACAEQLLLLDRWEAGIAGRLQLLDTSQHGNRSYLRNERFQGRPMIGIVASAAEWHLPETDIFEFDYSSGQRPSKDAVELDDITLDKILQQLQESECVPLDRVRAIRNISHRIHMTCLQVRRLLGIFREASARTELMVTILFRITDVWNEKMIRVRFENHEDIYTIQRRIGFVTFFPFIQPEQMKFEFDFQYNDCRLAANLLLLQAVREGEQNIKDFTYTLVDGTLEPLITGVPRTWEYIDRVPRSGVFRLTYTCAPEDAIRKLEARKGNLCNYGRWGSDIPEGGIMWWSALTGVPEDVIEYLLFLVRDPAIKRLEDAFKKIIGSSGKTSISFAQFQESIKKMDCKKFKGPDEQDRLKTIFRYLDPGGEGTVSSHEWGVLDQFWLELRLSIDNFILFLKRMFGGDLEHAFDFFIEHSGDPTQRRLQQESWNTAIKKCGYFGSVKPIFSYLDMDGNGYLDFKEFEALESYFASTR